MNKIICLTLSLLILFSVHDAFSQKKSEKRRKKKNKTEQVQPPAIPQQNPPAVQQPSGGQEIPPVIPPQPISQQHHTLTYEQAVNQFSQLVEQSQNGAVNWSEQYIEAKGQSVIDNQKFTNPAQAKLMAARGAVVVAQRNLLEIVQGVSVTSQTTVKDMVTQNDYIYTRLDGVVKNARQIGDAVEKDGFMEVTLRIPMYSKEGIAPVLYENIPGKETKSTLTEMAGALSTSDLGGAEGIVFNFNGKPVDPSMFPVVVDENGKILFDFYKLYDPRTGNFPQILQTSKELFQQLGFSQGVQVIDVAQSFDGKIQLDQLNAKKINWEKIGKFATTAGKILKFALALI